MRKSKWALYKIERLLVPRPVNADKRSEIKLLITDDYINVNLLEHSVGQAIPFANGLTDALLRTTLLYTMVLSVGLHKITLL